MMFRYLLTVFCIGAIASTSHATNVTLFEGDAEEWKSAVDYNFTTIDFTIGTHLAFIHDDYASEGVVFGSTVQYLFQGGFPIDDWGMTAVGGAWLTFDTPQNWIAADHPGVHAYELYAQGELVYSSPMLSWGGPGFGNFSGLVSSEQFDMVYIHRPDPWGPNTIAIDDLHFGALVPAPGALGLLGIACIFPRRRRRG